MTNMSRLSGLVLVAAAISIAAIYLFQPAEDKTTAAFECPEAKAKTDGSALQETPEQLASATEALKSPEQENAIRTLATDLKNKYPNADDAEIVNYMLTAYCPLVKAEDGLGDSEKQARMDRFSSQVSEILKTP